MGKRAREKKLFKLATLEQEKAFVEARRKERLTPTIRYTRSVLLTLIATVVLLWIGTFVTSHIGVIISRLSGERL